MLHHPADCSFPQSYKQYKYSCKLEKFKNWLIWDGYIEYDGSNISHLKLVEDHKRKEKQCNISSNDSRKLEKSVCVIKNRHPSVVHVTVCDLLNHAIN